MGRCPKCKEVISSLTFKVTIDKKGVIDYEQGVGLIVDFTKTQTQESICSCPECQEEIYRVKDPWTDPKLLSFLNSEDGVLEEDGLSAAEKNLKDNNPLATQPGDTEQT